MNFVKTKQNTCLWQISLDKPKAIFLAKIFFTVGVK